MVCMVFHRSYLNKGEMEEAKADRWAQVQPAPYTLSCLVKSKAAFMVLERWHILCPLYSKNCPSACSELRLQMVHKVCGASRLLATVACAVVRQSASTGAEPSFNVQNAEMKPNV